MLIDQHRIFGVFFKGGDRKKVLLSQNIVPSIMHFDEKLIKFKGKEFRIWEPFRSKLASAILKGCQDIKLREHNVVLYLGCSHGYTVSFVSDIIGKDGLIFALDIAPRPLRDLVFICEDRKNIAPILADANHPEKYIDKICQVDLIYQDISQKNQVEIFKKNVNLFLKKNGFGIITIKAKSIDISKKPVVLFNESRKELEKELVIVDYRTLEPFQLDHCFMIVKKKE